MGLDSLVRNAVKTANKATKSLQAKVTLQRWKSTDFQGAHEFASRITLDAIVDTKVKQRRMISGQLIVVKAYVVLLTPLTALGAAKRLEPIDPRDILTLPDGTTGPIIETAGFVDPGTNRPYLHEIWLGTNATEL